MQERTKVECKGSEVEGMKVSGQQVDDTRALDRWDVGEHGTSVRARGGGEEGERVVRNGCRKEGRGWDSIDTVEMKR